MTLSLFAFSTGDLAIFCSRTGWHCFAKQCSEPNAAVSGISSDLEPGGTVNRGKMLSVAVSAGIDYIKKGTEPEAFLLYDAHGNMVLTLSRVAGTAYSTANARFYDACRSAAKIPPSNARGMSAVNREGAVAYGDDDSDPSQRYCANLGHPSDDFVRGSGGNTDDDLIYMRARYYEPGTAGWPG